MKLPKSIDGYIEFELLNYPSTKKEIKELEQDIIFSAGSLFDDRIRTKEISKPTESKAIKLVSCVYYQRAKNVTSAIDRALYLGGADVQDVFKHKFIYNKPWQSSESDLYIGQSTYFRRLNQLKTLVAMQLGLINP